MLNKSTELGQKSEQREAAIYYVHVTNSQLYTNKVNL